MKNIIYLAIAFSFWSYAQTPKDSVKILRGYQKDKLTYIHIEQAFLCDTLNLLDKEFAFGDDSIRAYEWEGDVWFRWKLSSREWDEDRSVELFAFNLESNKLWQVTHNDLYWSSAYGGTIEQIYFFNDKMFTIGKSIEVDPVGDNVLLVIDSTNHSVSKELKLAYSSSVREISTQDSTLFVNMQPIDRSRNILYYLLLGAGGKQPKWHYTEIGNEIKYALDSNFNILRQIEVK